MSRLPISLLSVALLLGGCSLTPDYQRPASPSAAQYPQGPAYAAQSPHTPRVEDWRALFNDPALQQLIESALINNRDLRVAALNVDQELLTLARETLAADERSLHLTIRNREAGKGWRNWSRK